MRPARRLIDQRGVGRPIRLLGVSSIVQANQHARAIRRIAHDCWCSESCLEVRFFAHLILGLATAACTYLVLLGSFVIATGMATAILLMLVAIVAVIPWLSPGEWRMRSLDNRMCPCCRYDLSGASSSSGSRLCPECGAEWMPVLEACHTRSTAVSAEMSDKKR